MADANIPPRERPVDWSDAFGALPLERPPGDAWSRLASALPRHGRAGDGPRTRPARASIMRVVLAAAAAVVVAMPLAWWLGRAERVPTAVHVAAAGRVDPPALPVAAATVVPPGRPGGPREAVPGSAVAASTGATRAAVRIADAGGRLLREAAPSTARPVASATAPRRPDGLPEPRATPPAPPAAPADALAASDVQGPDLDALRLESARLEALVAYARDDRMASAPVAVMSASMDDRIRLIDAALMQAGLDDATRSTLWSERVGALRELASLEGTQRWMAAHGASLDAVARVD